MKVKQKVRILVFLIFALILTGCQSARPSNQNLADSKLVEKLSASSLGAVNPQLIFADDSNVIFYDHSGLIVFDYVEKRIIGALDFEEVEIKTQGDDAWAIYVDKEGTTVFFERLSTLEAKSYDIKKNVLKKLDSAVLEKGSLFNQYEMYSDYIDYYDESMEFISQDLYPLSSLIKLSDDSYVYLYHKSDTMLLKDLNLVITSTENTDIMPIFP